METSEKSVQNAIGALLEVLETKIAQPPATPVVGPRPRALAILRTKTEELAALAQYYGVE